MVRAWGAGRAAAVVSLVVLAAAAPATALHGEIEADARSSAHPRGSGGPGPSVESPGVPAVDLALHEAPSPGGIPWRRLDAEAYRLVRDVVSGALVEREVRDIAFRSRPEVFEFLLDHPDFAADVARVLREGKYRLRRVGEIYEADDGRGARGWIRTVFAAPGRRLFHLEGRYDPPLLPSLSGRLVILLDSEHLDGPDGITYCAMRVTGFLKVDTALAEVLARVSQSFSEAEVDRRVRRFFRHVAGVSRRAYDDPDGLADLLAGHPAVDPALANRFTAVLLARRLPPWAEPQGFRLLDSPLAGDSRE